MNFFLTKTKIKQWCGDISYKKGESYYRANKVIFNKYDAENSLFEAAVMGNSHFDVTVKNTNNGEIFAECTCPSLASYDKHCQHVAAVLLYIYDFQQTGNLPEGSSKPQPEKMKEELTLNKTQPDIDLAKGLLGLFKEQSLPASSYKLHFDSREQLRVEFTCKPIKIENGVNLFGVEARVGTTRLYRVQNIREFLDYIDRRESYPISNRFTYNPELHCFQKETDTVIQQLITIYNSEKIYRDTVSVQNNKMILIPPSFSEGLFPLLSITPSVKVDQGGVIYNGIQLSNGPIPVQFNFDITKTNSYQLDVIGLDRITVMEAYGYVLTEGKLVNLQYDNCKRLTELKQILDSFGKQLIQIPAEQLEPTVEKVIPGLMKLGNVRISQAVSDQLVKTPLKAKLFLDRVKNRLLAGLEFQYGNIVINPLERKEQNRAFGPILVRDGNREREIMKLMEESSFAMTEGGFFMHNEEAEYHFLYHIVPKLKKMVEIYATTAVRARLYTDLAPPKIRVEVDERTDWLVFQFDIQGIPESDIRKLLTALEEKRKYYRLPNGSFLSLESQEFKEIYRFMNEIAGNEGGFKEKEGRVPLINGIQLIDSFREANVMDIGKSFRQLMVNLRNPDISEFPLPDHLNPVLRDYQKFGYQWLKTLARYRFGGILADDMGLGKTLQSIAYIVSVLPEIRYQKLPALIVCPSSLLYNWRNELKKFAPEIRAVIADGSKPERIRILKDINKTDVIITSYPLLRRDTKLFGEQPFHTLILDEAQAFKNHTTQTAKAVKKIRANQRFALTGTPVENSLEELWSIFNVVFPNLFPGKNAFDNLSRENVAKRARPFILRRLKNDVLKELPEKIETTQSSELLSEQKKLYMAYLAKLKHETLKHLNKDTFQKNKIKVLAGLTRLRQLCCHPALFVEGYEGSSAKFEQLLELIEECRSSGKRMLIFSQFTKMLHIIGRELANKGVSYFYLDGNTSSLDRVELCNRFNEGEKDLFLISLKAGGTGLNLTGADTVILYDLWWNPAVEQQAADRAYRMGQKNVVQVIRLVAQGTIEGKMYELQEKKKHLIEEIIEPGQEKVSSLTEQEIRDILMI